MYRGTKNTKEEVLKRIEKKPNECWEWKGPRTPKGYGRFSFKSKPTWAHHFFWESINGLIPKKLHVLHRCDNPPCCNPAHLFLGTNKDNMADAVRKKRFKRGEQKPAAKLTEVEVLQIRKEYRKYDRSACFKALAEKFGVSMTTIDGIIHREIWAWLR